MTVVCKFLKCPYNSKDENKMCGNPLVVITQGGVCGILYKRDGTPRDLNTIGSDKVKIVVEDVQRIPQERNV